MKSALIFLFVLFLLNETQAQTAEFDPFRLEWKNFDSDEIKNKQEFTDSDGNRYQIMKHGRWRYINIWHEGKFVKHGKFYAYYNGKPDRIETWKHGKKHGEELIYYGNGKLTYKNYYKNGKKNGTCYYYDDKGTMRQRQEWEDGQQVSVQGYDKNGNNP